MRRGRGYPFDFHGYRPEPPRAVKGGIRAGTPRGGFARSWWGRRWIEVLEGFEIGARLSRGRAYARKGQVANLEIEPGLVRADVQGTRAKPYRILIELRTLSAARWVRVMRALRRRPAIAARLLNAEMPAELEALFRQAGASLFPEKQGDLATACSCPDWSNPCKHIAAVYYLLAETFDRDPFLLLKLRGLDRDAFVTRLKGAAISAAKTGAPPPAPAPGAAPLPADPAAFWRPLTAAPAADDDLPPPVAGTTPAERLGAFPFWRGREEFRAAMAAAYAAGAAAAERLLAAAPGPPPEDGGA
jgi:uncharacterized Zn finger protein